MNRNSPRSYEHYAHGTLGRTPGSPEGPPAAVSPGAERNARDRKWPDAKGDSGHPVTELMDSGLPRMLPRCAHERIDGDCEYERL